MVKIVKEKKTALQILIMITAIIYSIWVLLYLASFFLYSDFFNKLHASLYVSIGFTVIGVVSVSITATMIVKLKRDPFAIFSVFIIGGRLINFIAAYLFSKLTKNSFFMLPFGNPDFFIFYFLLIGSYTFIRKSVLPEKKYGFQALSLFSLLFLASPIFFHVIGKEITVISVYSIFYTLIPIAAILVAPYNTNLRSLRLIIISVITAAFFDMLIYLKFTEWDIPPDLNYLLLPYSLLILTASVIRREEEIANG